MNPTNSSETPSPFLDRLRPAGRLAIMLTLSLAALTGCGSHDASSPSAPAPSTPAPSASAPASPQGKSVKLAFVTNSGTDFWTLAQKGVVQAEKDNPGVDVQVVLPADGAVATQKSDVEDLLAKGVQGVAVDPIDPTNQGQDLKSWSSKVPLVTFDSDAPTSGRLCYIGSDNHAGGVMVADLLKQTLPSGGRIMLFVGKRDAQSARAREAGIRDGLKGSKIDIIDVRTDDADTARAKANAADTLVKYPDIAALVGLWSYNGPAILGAITDAGKVGKVKIVCFDDAIETLQGVKSGAIYGTVVQQPYQFGYQTVQILSQIAKGDKSHIPANGLDIIPTQEIKQGNVDGFMAKVAKLRSQPSS